MIRLHGVLALIVSDINMKFVGRFHISLEAAMGTTLSCNTAYHPQTDGQIERTNSEGLCLNFWERLEEESTLV